MFRPRYDQKRAPNASRLRGARCRHQAGLVAQLRAELAQKQALIEQQTIALTHSQKIFDRSSVAARLGVWECNLPSNDLTWTDVVYDIFDLPRGTALERSQTVDCYSLESRIELSRRRCNAIAERSGFTMDAEIVSFKGNRRWIRITATVECEDGEPVRIFGIKQDITEEKLMQDRTRYLASFDVMTGLANRAQFQSKLAEFCDPEQGRTAPAALLLIDLDGFKTLNDTFGHAAGDQCLQDVARRFERICGGAALIARIGGDEFAVLLEDISDESVVVDLAADIVNGLRMPIRFEEKELQISASVGIALVEDKTPSALFKTADAALYAAKAAGRNTFRISEPFHGMPMRRVENAA
jgi:diguanylate cyclase (GGDEF)-like protein